MSCNCNDNNVLKSDATASISSTNLILTTKDILSPINEGRLAFRLINSVPSSGANLPVLLSINGGTSAIPIYDKYGNIMYGYGIRPYAILKGYYGNNGSGGTAHVQLVNYPFYRQPRG